jgi:hypothetical protein
MRRTLSPLQNALQLRLFQRDDHARVTGRDRAILLGKIASANGGVVPAQLTGRGILSRVWLRRGQASRGLMGSLRLNVLFRLECLFGRAHLFLASSGEMEARHMSNVLLRAAPQRGWRHNATDYARARRALMARTARHLEFGLTERQSA